MTTPTALSPTGEDGPRSSDYVAFMRGTSGVSFIEAIEDEFRGWVEEKSFQSAGENSWRRPGAAASLDFAIGSAHPTQFHAAVDEGEWATELFASAGGWLHLEVRNSRGRRVAVPRIARALMRRLDLRDAALQLRDDVKMWDVGDLDTLVHLLTDPDRHGLVFVAGTGPDPKLFRAFEERVPVWTREVFGLAQSIVLTPQATHALEARLGAHAPGAWTLRTYYPGAKPGDVIDARRHRFLTTATLASDSDAKLRGVLASVARAHAVRRPTPPEVIYARRTFLRAQEARVINELKSPLEPKPSGERASAKTTAPPTPSALSQMQVEQTLALLGERLQVDSLSLEDVGAALDRLLQQAAQRRNAAEEAERSLMAQREAIERLEDQLAEGVRLLDDDALSQAQLQFDLDASQNEARWLRDRLREVQDFESAAGVAPAQESICPESCAALVDGLAGDSLLVFTGDRDEVEAVDDVDVLRMAVRTAFDACLSLREYARAKAEGAHDGGVDHFLRHRPSGYAGVSAGKHAATETAATMKQFGAQRVFSVPTEVDPSGKLTMTAHFKLARIGLASPRLYYYDDLAGTGRLYIGYLGKHLTNTRTN